MDWAAQRLPRDPPGNQNRMKKTPWQQTRTPINPGLEKIASYKNRFVPLFLRRKKWNKNDLSWEAKQPMTPRGASDYVQSSTSGFHRPCQQLSGEDKDSRHKPELFTFGLIEKRMAIPTQKLVPFSAWRLMAISTSPKVHCNLNKKWLWVSWTKLKN